MMAGIRCFLLHVVLTLAVARPAQAFVGAGRPGLGRQAFTGTQKRPQAKRDHVWAGGSRRTGAGPCMLSGQEFATCSDDEFKAYIIGWTFAWSGIIPYTILAAKVESLRSVVGAQTWSTYNVLGSVVSAKVLPAVSKGEDATVSNQPLLLYKEPIKLMDVVNIVGRFQTFDDLQTETYESGNKNNFLRRDTFKESLRRRKFKGWPNGPDGQPALSEALDVKTASRSMAKRELSESTMDAMFDSFCGSPLSAIADRFKVDNQLEKWRKDNTFNVKGFEGGLLFGRLIFLFTIVTVIFLELAGYGVFFVEPLIIRYGNPLAFLGL